MTQPASPPYLAIVFAVLAVFSACFGFECLAGPASWAAKVLFFVFFALAIIAGIHAEPATHDKVTRG